MLRPLPVSLFQSRKSAAKSTSSQVQKLATACLYSLHRSSYLEQGRGSTECRVSVYLCMLRAPKRHYDSRQMQHATGAIPTR